jgi:hypothetical protein
MEFLQNGAGESYPRPTTHRIQTEPAVRAVQSFLSIGIDVLSRCDSKRSWGSRARRIELKLWQAWVLTGVTTMTLGAILGATWWLDDSADIWEKIGHLADLAQLLGLIAAVVAVPQLFVLMADQRRLVRSLEATPNMVASFETIAPPGQKWQPLTVLAVSPRWQDAEEFSEPVQFAVTLRNTGTGTARDVHINVNFAPALLILKDDGNPVGAPGQMIRVERGEPFIHPGAQILVAARARIRRNAPGTRIEIDVDTTLADTPRRVEKLSLQIA